MSHCNFTPRWSSTPIWLRRQFHLQCHSTRTSTLLTLIGRFADENELLMLMCNCIQTMEPKMISSVGNENIWQETLRHLSALSAMMLLIPLFSSASLFGIRKPGWHSNDDSTAVGHQSLVQRLLDRYQSAGGLPWGNRLGLLTKIKLSLMCSPALKSRIPKLLCQRDCFQSSHSCVQSALNSALQSNGFWSTKKSQMIMCIFLHSSSGFLINDNFLDVILAQHEHRSFVRCPGS